MHNPIRHELQIKIPFHGQLEEVDFLPSIVWGGLLITTPHYLSNCLYTYLYSSLVCYVINQHAPSSSKL